jgi:hypothetical protein
MLNASATAATAQNDHAMTLAPGFDPTELGEGEERAEQKGEAPAVTGGPAQPTITLLAILQRSTHPVEAMAECHVIACSNP